MTALATAASYDEMIDALVARKNELGLSNEMVDELTGLPGGYTGKVLGPARVKKMGALSLWLMLEVLALKIEFHTDLQTAEKMAVRWEKRSEGQANLNNNARPLSMRALAKKHRATFRASGKAGNRARQAALSPEKRSMLARRAAKKRWRTPKVVDITTSIAEAKP